MCLVKVNRININTRLHHTVERMIRREDDNVLTHCLPHINKRFDTVRLSGSGIFGLTTMNVKDNSISNMLKILRAELICQQNTRSNNNNRAGNVDAETPLCIHNTDQSFTTTSGENALTDSISLKRIKGALLMRTESDCHNVGVCNTRTV